MFALVTLVIFGWSLSATRVVGMGPKSESVDSKALFLTPYIEKNQLAAGRKAASVTPLIGKVKSFAGFFTVNITSNSNLFFWFFPAEKDPEAAPVTLWLQGGPGTTSLYGLFYEHGPFTLLEDFTLEERRYRWTRTMNMIYIDNPVGTGFSFTDDEFAYATEETDVARDLYNALIQFFTLFPTYRTNPFYLAGESYAGKYIPALGYYIHTHNPGSSHTINLQGLVIGNGLVDPKNMVKFGEYLYEHGLIDNIALGRFREEETNVLEEIEQCDWYAASADYNEIVSVFIAETQNVSIYNYLMDREEAELILPLSRLSKYFEDSKVRQAIHVGNAYFTFQNNSEVNEKVSNYLYEDISKSVVSWLEDLINNYRVVLYSGQLDVIVPYPLTLSFVQKMKWSGSVEYHEAKRVPWRVNGKLAGFAKSGGNFTEVLVRNAGHFVPVDQPLYTYDLITRVVQGIPFNSTIEIE